MHICWNHFALNADFIHFVVVLNHKSQTGFLEGGSSAQFYSIFNQTQLIQLIECSKESQTPKVVGSAVFD